MGFLVDGQRMRGLLLGFYRYGGLLVCSWFYVGRLVMADGMVGSVGCLWGKRLTVWTVEGVAGF